MTAIRDARSQDLPQRMDADVVVAGAGAAGITIARELAARGHHVLLVESGGDQIEAATQSLYVAKNSGIPYFDLASCRLRYFGGSTNHWGGYCRANDPEDYEPRAELGLPVWPINHATLAPWIDKAATLLNIDNKFFDPTEQLRQKKLDPAALVDGKTDDLVTKTFQITDQLRFKELFRDEIAAHPRIDPVEHLNIVEIILGPGGAVDHLRAKTLDGKETRIHARRYVLACHAIENARLLLESNAQRAQGIGNAHDHVGRYFMEHPHVVASRMIPSPDFPTLYNRDFMRQFRLNANLGLSYKATRENGILSYYCRFNPVFTSQDTIRAMKRIRGRLMEPASLGLYNDMKMVMGDLEGLVTGALHRTGRNPQPIYYQLEHRAEQAPNPDSRITLSDKRNKLGQREVQLHWALSDLDVKTLNTGQNIVARELSALNMGRFELEEINMPMLRERALGHYHHIGTTRMSERPEDGVVDPNLRLHDVPNLYVAGSGVFPTAGYSGPTMMLIAMAIRLADHLSQTLRTA